VQGLGALRESVGPAQSLLAPSSSVGVRWVIRSPVFPRVGIAVDALLNTGRLC